MSLKEITKKIALTALAAIYGNSDGISGMGNNIPQILSDSDSNNNEISILKPIFLLKKPVLDVDRYAANPHSHRSHRSHSSHRSHMSSRSSYSTKPSTNYTPSRSTYTPSNSTSNYFYTPPKPTYSLGSRVLDLNMTGDDVKELNKLLVKKGYLSSAYKYESNYTSSTKSAVKKIQRENGLTVDGQVNTITLIYIQQSSIYQPSYSTPSYNSTTKNYQLGDRTLYLGKKGSDVLELKKELSALGLLSYNIDSNSFDSYTKSAVVSYQIRNGLSADGIVGPNTLSYIQSSYSRNITPNNFPNITNYYSNSNESDTNQGLIYFVTKATSLRQRAESSSAVTDRLREGDSVIILNSIQEHYWWKVSHEGKVGWVKSHLLRK